MDEAKSRGGIDLIGGMDARDAICVEADVNWAGQALDTCLLLPWRQSEPQQACDQRPGQQNGEADTHQGAAKEAKQRRHAANVAGQRAEGK